MRDSANEQAASTRPADASYSFYLAWDRLHLELRGLAIDWLDTAAETFGADPDHATLIQCSDQLRAVLDKARPSKADHAAADRINAELVCLRTYRDEREGKRAPVQGFPAGIPWALHMKAYEVYCKRYGEQQAMIEGGCRGGFGMSELDSFIPGWRARVSDIDAMRQELRQLRELPGKVDVLRAALERVVADWVNPGDGGEFEDGEMPALDQARAALSSSVPAAG